METGHDHEHQKHDRRCGWGWWFFAAAAAFYLFSEHRAHLLGVLPYLFILACPLMHLFMHHGHHHGHGGENKSKDEGESK